MKRPLGKAPAFQWYPGDHRRDTGVSACSFEARGLWRELLDLMHDGEPRGYLTAGGAPIEPEDLVRMVGVPLVSVKRWLAELERRKVFSRTAEGIIYSRRMVRDEHISQVRRDAGHLGGNPDLLNQNASKTEANREAKANLGPEQKPTPAVADCGLRTAVASFPLLDLDQERSQMRSGKDSAPPADARTERLLEGIRAFLVRFYRTAPAKRQRDVCRQLGATLEPPGALLSKGLRVLAHSPERLVTKLREVMAEGVNDNDKAIVVLLLKLGDTSDGSAPGVAAAASVEREERASESDIAAAKSWVIDRQDVRDRINAQIDRDVPGNFDETHQTLRAMAYSSLVVKAWREAGAGGSTPHTAP